MDRKPVILIVDDVQENLRLLGILGDEFCVQALSGGIDVLAKIKASAPDLILLNSLLTCPDGFELCRQLKADSRLSMIPVIFICAPGMQEHRIAALREGAADYITAPFLPDEVLARVRTHLRLSRLADLRCELTASADEQDMLRSSDANCRTLIDALPDLVWLKDPDGVYLHCNRRFESLYGLKERELVGKTDYDFVDKKLADFFREHDKAALAAGKPTRNDELLTFACDGHQEHIEAIKTPIFGNDGVLIGVLGVGRNITDRKQVELALQTSEQKFRSLIEQAGDGFELLDENGRYMDANAATCRMTGYSKEELKLLAVPDIDPGNSLEMYKADFTALIGKPPFTFESRHRRKDGSVFPVEVTASIVEIAGKYCALTNIRDISLRKQEELVANARMQLIEAGINLSLDNFLEKTLDVLEAATGSTIGFYHFVDADQRTLLRQSWSTNTLKRMCSADGKYQHYSVEKAGVWTDCVRTRSPVIHNDYASLPDRKGLPPGHAKIVRDLVVPVTRGDRVAALVCIGNKPEDYSQADLDLVSRIADLSWDIVARKQAEVALRFEQERAQHYLDTVEAVIVALDAEGRISMINRKGCQLLKRLEQDLVGQSWFELCLPQPNGMDVVYPYFRKLMKGAAGTDEYFESAVCVSDGTIREIAWHNTVLRDSSGQITGTLSAGEDITDRKEAARREKVQLERMLQSEKLAEAQHELLIQADKMVALGTLVSGVAHEINNPNQFIMLNVPVLETLIKKAQPLLDRELEQNGDFLVGLMKYSELKGMIPNLLAGINKGSLRIKHIGEELLKFSRQSVSTTREEVDLAKVVDSAVYLMENMIRKSTDRFVVTKEDSIPWIIGNFQRIEQVVINLLQNACQSLPDRKKGVEVRVFCDDSRKHAVIQVRDEGSGMTAETLQRIEEPFFTTKQASGGTGLGISISSRIIKAHGGTLRFSSEPGNGTIASVELPIG